jgi:hypothetical protein
MHRSLLRVFALSGIVTGGLWSSIPAPTWAVDEDRPDLARPGAPANEEVVRSTYKESVVVERTTTVREKEIVARKPKEKYRAAIFVANRSKQIDEEKVLVMQDFLTAHATEQGFEIIAREDVLNSVAKLTAAGPNRGAKGLPGEQMDELLSNNTSALNLAQNLNADYVLMITISSYGTNKTRFSDPKLGIDVLGQKSQLKATYRLLDTTVGGSQIAGVATAIVSDRVDSRTQIVRETLVDDLLDGAAMDMAGMMGTAAKGGRIPDVKVAKGNNQFEIHCGVADLVFPEIVKDEKGQYVVSAGRYKLEQLAVTVELDGVVVGTSPGPLTARPGLHKVRLRREKFKDWEGTVFIQDGQLLQIAMQMTPEGLAQFAAMTKFFQDLKTNTILSEAQAKMWEGYAKQLETSGTRVDKKVNIDKQIRIDERGNGGRDDRRDPPAGNRNDLRRQVTGEDEPRAAPGPSPRVPPVEEPKLKPEN